MIPHCDSKKMYYWKEREGGRERIITEVVWVAAICRTGLSLCIRKLFPERLASLTGPVKTLLGIMIKNSLQKNKIEKRMMRRLNLFIVYLHMT